MGWIGKLTDVSDDYSNPMSDYASVLIAVIMAVGAIAGVLAFIFLGTTFGPLAVLGAIAAGLVLAYRKVTK